MEFAKQKAFPHRSALSNSLNNTVALFARASRNSSVVIVPVNDCALNESGSEPAFYCVHSITGTVRTDFIDLARCLESKVRFYGLQAPPRLIQDSMFGCSIESLASHYADELNKFQPSGPIVLGGYCAGAVVALEMAKKLRLSGREVGPLVAIDGAPENAGLSLSIWKRRHWGEMLQNLGAWATHGDLVRNPSPRLWAQSLTKNLSMILKETLGLSRFQRWDGGYSIDGLLDLTPFPPAHRLFINRFFAALFLYVPELYNYDVTVYEAKITSLFYMPHLSRVWRKIAPDTETVPIVGTHVGMMHEPYVNELADRIGDRITRFFAVRSPPPPVPGIP
jgi:thioesterase domain-containing protein